MRSSTRVATMAEAIFPRQSLLRDAALVVGFALLTRIGALITIPLPFAPVPITGQTFAVLVAGAMLGSRRGALSQLTYLIIGITGIPYWFALDPRLPSGIARLLGPTGFYLLSFPIAAFVVGWLAERGWDRRVWTTAAAMLIGSIVIHAIGLSWYIQFFRPTMVTGVAAQLLPYDPTGGLLAVMVYPYIPGDLFKLVLAAVALPSGWAMLKWTRR